MVAGVESENRNRNAGRRSGALSTSSTRMHIRPAPGVRWGSLRIGLSLLATASNIGSLQPPLLLPTDSSQTVDNSETLEIVRASVGRMAGD